MPTLAIHFVRFGPYHLSRLKSARQAFEPKGWSVRGLEISAGDSTYAWREEIADDGHKVTVFKDATYEAIPAASLAKGVHAALDRLKPAAVAIAGWGSVDARACLSWCRKSGATAIVMSETREADGRRFWWKELLKSRIIRKFDGALVGGQSHRDYLMGLGMNGDRVRIGYNVVDNGYFAREAARWRGAARGQESEIRSQESEIRSQGSEVEGRSEGIGDQTADFESPFPSTINPQPSPSYAPYFLASNRFIPRKNLSRLVEAFAKAGGERKTGLMGWDLCLLGDGELKTELIAQCGNLGLEVAECAPWQAADGGRARVFFPGFCQIDELPRFYAHAGCFVHPALEEPWGLVINEAMACGLPILSSSNVGAAEELLEEGGNGWRFDPTDLSAITSALLKVAGLRSQDRRAMGLTSLNILESKAATVSFGGGLISLLLPDHC